MGPKPILKQQIYDALKDSIIHCDYPPGMQLNEDQLCQQFGASRTPVRDALSRLEQEGLVSILSKRGIVINTVSLSSVNELFEVRMRIEPYAVLTYGNRQSDDTYARYIRQFEETKLSGQAIYDLDDQFHRSFIVASKNRYLSMFFSITTNQTIRYRILSAFQERLRVTQKEHAEIAACCLRRNWTKAAECMRNHIEMSRNSIIDYALSQNVSSTNIFSNKTVNPARTASTEGAASETEADVRLNQHLKE